MKDDILDIWTDYFIGLLSPVTFITSDAQEVHLGEENTTTAA